jgi:hypothetical protein
MSEMHVIVYTGNDGTPSVVGPFYSSDAAVRYDTAHPQEEGVDSFVLPLERRAETLTEQRLREATDR